MASILEIDPEEAGLGAAAATFGQFSGPQRLPQNLGSILGRAGGAYTQAKNNAIKQGAEVGLLRDQTAQREMAILLQVQQQQRQQKFQSILGQQQASGQPLDEISILGAGIQSGAFGPKETTEFMSKVMEKQKGREDAMERERLRLADKALAREDKEASERRMQQFQAESREAQIRLAAALRPPQKETLKPVMGADGKVRYVKESEAAGQEVPPSTANRPLPTNAIKDLGEKGESVVTFRRLLGNFKDDFGGKKSETAGNIENAVGRTFDLGKGSQADWWQDYQNQKNIIRNKLFGSALTQTEKEEFDKANIHPGMTPEIIKSNLSRQHSAAVRAARKMSGAYKAGGYSEEMINEALGFSSEDLAAEGIGGGGAGGKPKPWERNR